ncbi:MAG: hypothetical protein HC859_09435 [Bacteroidia bacterium]|nr:hypothetical protein [Bacteroidia bacterium]
MSRIVLAVCCGLISISLHAQVRVSKLVIKKNEHYEFKQTDILVADTIIMMDSSRIILNKLKKENYIRAQLIIVGRHCIIDGTGVNGTTGNRGRDGDTPIGPCKSGENGRNGSRGLDGANGVDLFLYTTNLQIKGRLIINLGGGNGGHGGDGGNGGGGSPGTVHCNGGNGGFGGAGGGGGNGGAGGTLNVNCVKCPNPEGNGWQKSAADERWRRLWIWWCRRVWRSCRPWPF